MIIDENLLDNLIEQAKTSPRLRTNYDLRTSSEDASQRVLNALMPGTQVPIHRHTKSTETLVLIRGKIEEIFYGIEVDSVFDGDSRCMDVFRKRELLEMERILLTTDGPIRGLSIPVGQWHRINVLEPSVIFECQDGKYEPLGEEDVIKLQ